MGATLVYLAYSNFSHAAPLGTTSVAQTSAVGDGVPITTTSDSASESPTPATSTTTALSAGQLRTDALRQLQDLVNQDAATDPIRGQWVAQLASKYEGVSDKRQQSTPFTVVQIYDEHMRLRDDPRFGADVRLLLQGDWGGSKPHNPPLWVTVVDLNLSDRGSVTSWCESMFAQRGSALLDVCYPRQLRLK